MSKETPFVRIDDHMMLHRTYKLLADIYSRRITEFDREIVEDIETTEFLGLWRM